MNDTFEVVRLTGYSGTMTKNISEMTSDEYKAWQIESNQKVRRTLFAKNMPMVHKKDGHVVAEYADGRIEIIR
ncbi:MAG: hypothetical protein U5M51_05900 [Emticicia sp.]|nr:hypothetical protein [Emticicia sp.]